VFRRTRVALYDPDARAGIARAVVERMAPRVGWNEAQAAAQIEAVDRRLAADLAFQEEPP
jgi:glycerol-3-phosphate dehydrogenase